MKVRCFKRAYHKGRIWREGEVYEYPEGETPPAYAFEVLETEKKIKDAEKGTRKARIEDAEKEKISGKDFLVTRATSLGIASPSQLARWSVDRLKSEIQKAENGDENGAESGDENGEKGEDL